VRLALWLTFRHGGLGDFSDEFLVFRRQDIVDFLGIRNDVATDESQERF